VVTDAFLSSPASAALPRPDYLMRSLGDLLAVQGAAVLPPGAAVQASAGE
jgi:hypothetical protein